MMIFFRIRILAPLLFVLALSPGNRAIAQSSNSRQVGKTLNVGVAGSEPFVVSSKNGYSGIAVEIWELIAGKAGWRYRYIPFPSVHGALDSMKSGGLDLVIGPISITSERAEEMRFSQPYYQSSLAILSRMDKPKLLDRITPFFSANLFIAVSIFLIILALVGTLIWLAERNRSPEQFPHDFTHGVGNGMWLAIVTMSTTGYGDRAPVTFWGRIIASCWMVISIIFATSMVAGIASTLTLTGMGNQTIQNLEQLQGKKVATISGSSAEEFLSGEAVKKVSLGNLDDACTKLRHKVVDAVVYDRPQLLYYLKKTRDKQLQVSQAEYYKQGYGIAFPLHTPLSHSVNVLLLEVREEKKIERVVHYWLNSID